jgi:hypothetical protein
MVDVLEFLLFLQADAMLVLQLLLEDGVISQCMAESSIKLLHRNRMAFPSP